MATAESCTGGNIAHEITRVAGSSVYFKGSVVAASAGKMGFRGSKKNTPYAAQMAAQDCAKRAYDLGLRKVKAYAVSYTHLFFVKRATFLIISL